MRLEYCLRIKNVMHTIKLSQVCFNKEIHHSHPYICVVVAEGAIGGCSAAVTKRPENIVTFRPPLVDHVVDLFSLQHVQTRNVLRRLKGKNNGIKLDAFKRGLLNQKYSKQVKR